MTIDKEEKQKEVLVVAQLPQQPAKEVIGEDGKHYVFMTIEEALTEILANIREIKKSVA